MNFLELVQRTRRECGISGTGPLSTVGQSGEMLRLVDWVRDAYLEIQNAQPRWNWLNKTAGKALLAGGRTFDPVTDWSLQVLKYDHDSFVLAGSPLTCVAYPVARDRFRSVQTARPTEFAILPSRKVQFNAILDQDYTLSFDYYAEAEELAADTDVPSMPSQYHMAVVWKALSYYADYEEVPYLMQRSVQKFNQIYEQMLRTELPDLVFAGPLA